MKKTTKKTRKPATKKADPRKRAANAKAASEPASVASEAGVPPVAIFVTLSRNPGIETINALKACQELIDDLRSVDNINATLTLRVQPE